MNKITGGCHCGAIRYPRVHAIGISGRGFSNRGERRRTAIRFCDAIPNWVG